MIELQGVTQCYASPSQVRSKSRQDFVIKEADFTIPQGARCAVLGANGTGKTTLLKMLCGLVLPTSGSIRVMGADPGVQWPQITADVGYINTDELGFYDRLSGWENIVFFARLRGLDLRHIREHSALHWVEPQWLERRYQELSGGAKRRLALVRALLHNPKVLLLDEPTRNLDAKTQNAIWDWLASLDSTYTVVLSTHNSEKVFTYADYFVLIDGSGALRAGALEAIGGEAAVRSFLMGAA